MSLQNNSLKNNSSTAGWNTILISQQESMEAKISTPIKQQKLIDKKYFDILQEFLQSLKQSNKNGLEKGKNHQFDFKQQWEGKSKYRYQTAYSQYKNRNFIFSSSMIITLVLQMVVIWFISVFRVFRYQDNHNFFIFCLLVQVLDSVIKCAQSYFYKFKHQNITEIDLKEFLPNYLGNIYLILYSIFGVIGLITDSQVISLLILDTIALVLCCWRFDEIYSHIKLISFNSKFKSYLRLGNLMSTLIIIIHSFSVLLYFVSRFNSQNFLAHIEDAQTKIWFQLYVYSFYFACTTVLTVGYGDILPQNLIEIFINLLMQIFGTVMIVYLNGQVGNILVALRKQKQILQNDLSTLQKVAQNFKLSLDTTHKIKQNLLDNSATYEQKIHAEENSLLSKVYSDLKDQALLTDSINAVKNCKFIVNSFSLKTQMLIARKLVNKLYSPNHKFLTCFNINKLYILKKGQVSLYVTKKDNKEQLHRKIVKTIKCQQNNDNQNNCFGYTSLIAGKSNRLKMITKCFSNILSIEQKDFVETIRYCDQDFQKYHQLRTMYLTQKNYQKFQAEMFNNQKDHYTCNDKEVIKQYLKSSQNRRKQFFVRSLNRKKRVIDLQQTRGSSLKQFQSSISKQVSFDPIYQETQQDNKSQIKEPAKQVVRHNTFLFKMKTSKNLKNPTPHFFKQYFKQKPYEMIDLVRCQEPFECSKQYVNFYADFNLEQLINKYSLINNPLDFLFNKRSKVQSQNSSKAPIIKRKRVSTKYYLLKQQSALTTQKSNLSHQNQ